ncbi:hypothetical protein MHBDNKMI_02461 [Aeromonas jandaei]
MGLGVKRAQRDYSLTFKLALVEQIEKGELKVGTGCFGYWPSTVCWCHPGGSITRPPTVFIISTVIPTCSRLGGAGHAGGSGASVGRRYHLSASQERAAVLEPGGGCVLTQDSGSSSARRNARRVGGELIHYSDRSVQYCSGLYQSLHERHVVRCSMTDGA